MVKYKALIVDDEHYARVNLQAMLEEFEDLEIIGACADGVDAVDQIISIKPDIVFLDIQMPEIDGFGVIRLVGDKADPVYIFATAFNEHAIRAFEVNAIDYLLKPFDADRLRQAVDKAINQLRSKAGGGVENAITKLMESISQTESSKPERIAIRDGNKISFVKVEDIIWIEADNQYIKLHTATRSHLLRESLTGMESQLDGRNFVRVHRSGIVNINFIDNLESHFNGEYIITMSNGSAVKLSKTYREALKKRITW